MTKHRWTTGALGLLETVLTSASTGKLYFQGAKPSEAYHTEEVEAWEGTVYAKSYQTVG